MCRDMIIQNVIKFWKLTSIVRCKDVEAHQKHLCRIQLHCRTHTQADIPLNRNGMCDVDS